MSRINRLAGKRLFPANIKQERIYKTNFGNHDDQINEEKYLSKLSNIYHNWISTWKEISQSPSILQEFIAGTTVAAVALPLNLALAVASGLPPSVGLLAGAIGGGVAAIFGGASLQVSGPAAALSLMVFGIVKDFGATGAAGAALIVGIIQIILALAMAGKLIRFVPEAILAGFMSGIGLKLLDNQIPELFGVNYKVVELAQLSLKPLWLHEVSWLAAFCGLFVAFLIITGQKYKRFPAGLAGIVIVSVLSVYLGWDIKRVGVLDSVLPHLNFPNFGADQWSNLIIRCIPIALLGSAESLLASSAIDRIIKAKKSHDSNLELIGQGLANTVSGLFSGMPVTGVIVRSSVNIQAGGKSKISSIVHSVILLLSFIFIADKIAIIPLAGLAGLLCVVGIRLVDIEGLKHLYKESKILTLAFFISMIGTVTGHLMLGLITAGVIFFIRHQLTKKKKENNHLFKNASKEIIKKDANEIYQHPVRSKNKHYDFEKEHEDENWLLNIKEKALVAASAFIHSQASVIGKVILGKNVHIAAGASVRADEGTPFYIGNDSNIQDGVVIHALKEKWISVDGQDWAVYVGKNVSMAHQALIHGPCFVGDNTFIGFKAVVHDSVVGPNCYIGIGAIVVGVEIPEGKHVPNGMVIDSLDKVDKLPNASKHHHNFNEDVVEVNKGLALAYNDLFDENEDNRTVGEDIYNQLSKIKNFQHKKHEPLQKF
ncbi:MAG: SulP family inorganic anion transporter [Bacteriovorax sp.]|nr:SulP family inorganic anion transporter [Bacteriovorax sp.]